MVSDMSTCTPTSRGRRRRWGRRRGVAEEQADDPRLESTTTRFHQSLIAEKDTTLLSTDLNPCLSELVPGTQLPGAPGGGGRRRWTRCRITREGRGKAEVQVEHIRLTLS